MSVQAVTFDGRQGWLARLVSTLSDPVRGMSLVEQGLISGGNFFALMAMARSFPAEAFGVFSFAYISLQFLLNLHRSTVVVPFIIHTAEPGALKRDGRLWQTLNVAFVAATVLGLCIAALIMPSCGAPPWMSWAFLIAAGFIGPNFFYEFFRRWGIQLGRYGLALIAAGLYSTTFVLGSLVAIHFHALPVAMW